MKQKISTMNISLPAALREQLEKKLARHAYGSASEYVRELIRKDLQREAIAQVDTLLLEGLHSGPPVPVNDRWWRERKAVLKKTPRAPRRRRA